MDLKTLLAMTSDTGFEDDTLMAVLDSLPDFELYKDDPTKGNSINMILEKKVL